MRRLLSHYDRMEDFPWWIQIGDKSVETFMIPWNLRESFINDCRALFFDWRKEHTSELLSYMKSEIFDKNRPKIGNTLAFDIQGCPLLKSFPETFVRVVFMALWICSSYNHRSVARIGLNIFLPRVVDLLLFDNLISMATGLMESLEDPEPQIIIQRRTEERPDTQFLKVSTCFS